MKITKIVSAAVVSVAMAATMAFSAAAATTDKDVVAAANNNAVPANNVQQLENFFASHAGRYSEEDFNKMIEAINSVGDTLKSHISEGALADLSEDQKVELFKGLSEEERQGILTKAKETAKQFGVTLTFEKADKGYNVLWVIDAEPATSGTDSKTDTSKAAEAGKVDKTVSNTGSEANNTAAAFMAAMAIALAGTGIVVVAKKNKEN